MPAQNPSEQFVHDLCTKSFFSLWSYLNPLREDGSELCDILVKFRDDLIVISVKDISFNEDANNYHVAANRWTRRAVDESIKQILGAERHLLGRGSFRVKATADGELFRIEGIKDLHIHRVSISLGSGGMIPLSFGRHDGKFVHVLTEEGLGILFRELDTMPDFAQYLSAREDFFINRCHALLFHSEGDLWMLYLREGDRFPDYSDRTSVHLQDAGYDEFIESPEYKAKKKADEPVSYTHLTLPTSDLV